MINKLFSSIICVIMLCSFSVKEDFYNHIGRCRATIYDIHNGSVDKDEGLRCLDEQLEILQTVLLCYMDSLEYDQKCVEVFDTDH